jgi:hypothetical protein
VIGELEAPLFELPSQLFSRMIPLQEMLVSGLMEYQHESRPLLGAAASSAQDNKLKQNFKGKK